MSDPNQPPPSNQPPAGYAQPGASGGFTPVPGQAPYAPGGFGAPQMPGYPPPGQPGYYPPPAGYPPAGYAPTGYPPPAGYPPPPSPGYGAPAGYPPAPAAGYPGYAPAYPYQQPPNVPYNPVYAPPAGVPPPGQGYAPPPGPPPGGAMPVAGPPEPPTVVYRDITVHNPRYEGGLTVWGYSKDDIKRDCDEIAKHADNNKKLVETLTRLGPLKMEVVAQNFHLHNRKNETLHHLIERKTTNPIEAVLLGLILGPIKYDAERVHDAVYGAGTNEALLDEILLDLSPTDVNLLTYAFRQKYNIDLSKRVQDDLSGNVKKLFAKLLAPNRVLRPSIPPYPPAPATNDASTKPATPEVDDPQKLLEADVAALYHGGAGRVGTNENAFYDILTGRTHEHLIQICRHYHAKHNKTLSHAIENEFSGHDRNALLHIMASAEVDFRRYPKLKPEAVRNVDPQAVRDAVLLEDTMKGLGTKDSLLGMRILRAHWSRRRMDAVSAAYLDIYDKKLTRRVAGETSGAWEDLLIAMITSTAY